MAPTSAPYGTWTSPVSAAVVAKSGVSFDDVLVDSKTNAVYHLERRPSEGGRIVLVDSSSKKDVFGKGWNARTGVHEYGGASALVYAGVAYFSNFGDGRVYKVAGGAEPTPVTPENKNHRFANFAAHPISPGLLVSILEDHTHPAPADVVTSLVTIDTHSGSVHPLLSGADFYAAPAFSPDGTHLAWIQWNHPDMPWDGAQVYVGDIGSEDGALKVNNVRKIKGEWKTESAVRPRWVGSNTLLFASDESGYQNPWIIDLSASSSKPRPVLPSPLTQDFVEPDWILGMSSSAVLSESAALWSVLRDGRSILYLVDLRSGEYKELHSPYVTIKSLHRTGSHSAVFLGSPTDGPMVVVSVVLDSSENAKFSILTGGEGENVVSKPDLDKVGTEFYAPPRPLTFKGRDGGPLYVVFYAPTNPNYTGLAGERPPCIVYAHGGPTSMTDQGLSLRKQYFTSRGFAWVDVNYGGSSGYGRKYIERLDGQWGVADVSDCVDAARALASPTFGEIDPSRVLITGGSAGGYTVLQSLCSAPPGVFAAGTSSYGISNLFTLSEDTHKFESRYGEKLLGGTPEQIPEVLKARSPVFHAERITAPLLILQGADDKVVPPSQAVDMKRVIESHGGRVEYVLFEGEGHGWRKAETMETALTRELAFYLDVLGLKGKSI